MPVPGRSPAISTRIRCTLTEPTTGTVYDVEATYRDRCAYSHDAGREHLCDLTLRTRPIQEPDEPFTLCDITTVPTPVLVAVQTRLHAILTCAATTLAAPAERTAPLVSLDVADESTVSRRTIGSRQGSADRARSPDE